MAKVDLAYTVLKRGDVVKKTFLKAGSIFGIVTGGVYLRNGQRMVDVVWNFDPDQTRPMVMEGNVELVSGKGRKVYE